LAKGTHGRRDRQLEILDAATRVIAANGFAGMRVEQVAAEAGVSIALLYYHFQSRNGLLRAALSYAHARAPSTGRLAELPADRSAYDVLRDALLAELDETPAVRDFSIVWGEATANAVFQAELRGEVERVAHSWADDVAAAIRAGIGDGSIASSVDPGSAASILTVLTDGLCARRLAGVMELDEARGVLDAAIAELLRRRGGALEVR
jgi:AcrR family transcriptional regulator